MYEFSVEQVLDEEFLTKLVKLFRKSDVPRFKYLEKYYMVKNKILKRTMDIGKPNNKLAHGFAKYITNMATSYFCGKPIKYVVRDEGFKDALKDILKDNYIDNLNFELSKEASKKGIAFELLYINEKGSLKSKKCKAEEIIPIYSNSIGEFLECAVRVWTDYDIDGHLIADNAAVYTKKDIWFFKRTNLAAHFEFVNLERHMFEDVPVMIYSNNEEQTADFEDIISLIDAYDKGQSDTSNDMEYFTDAYMWIAGALGGLTNAAADDEDEGQDSAAATLRKNRLLFLDEKGQAGFLTKNINDSANENFKNRIYNNIFFLSQVPNLSDESFSGNLTGVAIKYKLIGLEELAIMKQNNFEAAQKKKIKMITEFINTKMNKNYDPDMVERKYERNFTENIAEMIENATKLENVVSKETQLNMLPNSIVEDAALELEKLMQEEKHTLTFPMVTRQEINDNLTNQEAGEEIEE